MRIEAPVPKETSPMVKSVKQIGKQTVRQTWRIVDCHMLCVTATDPPPANSLIINSRLIAKLILMCILSLIVIPFFSPFFQYVYVSILLLLYTGCMLLLATH